MKDSQDYTTTRAKTSRSPEKPIDDIIMERIRCASGYNKQMFFARAEQNESKILQKSCEKEKVAEELSPEVFVFTESAILDKFARILDSKLAPANEILDRMEKKISDLQTLPVQKLAKSVAHNPELMTGIEKRFQQFFQETMAQTRHTIGEGVNFYNQSLANRQTQYKQEHDTITQTFMQASRTIIDSRIKLNITNHDRIIKAIMKLKDCLEQNCQGLEAVSCELDKVTIYLERYLEEREKQRQKLHGINDEIDPEDLIELDEEEIIKILMERMNIPNLPEISYAPPTQSAMPRISSIQMKPAYLEPKIPQIKLPKKSSSPK